MSFRETGRLTLRTFNKLYQHYKNNWDFEMKLRAANMTYAEAFFKSQKDEEWI